MEILIAAVVLAVGLVVAAALVTRGRAPTRPPLASRGGGTPAVATSPGLEQTGAVPASEGRAAAVSDSRGARSPADAGPPGTPSPAGAASVDGRVATSASSGAGAALVASAPVALGTHPAPGLGAPSAPDLDALGLAREREELAREREELAREREELAREREELAGERAALRRELERVAGLSAAEAKHLLLKDLEDDLRHERAKLLRQVEQETKRDAARRVRSILAVAMQRLAAGHASETTVSVVHLGSDDMKGRIIGREGRNIRALENLTGVDFIIDDTPNAVVLSGFDGVRRELARMTLERLLQDGRIHPARIEETFYQAKSDLDAHIAEAGEQAVLDANVGGLDGELVRILGRLRFRTSYGQNVLAHSVETAHLAALMADELGASAKTARRAALLHDIGKAVSHEIEGPHALVGGDLARRHGEPEAVAHAMEAHHNEVEPQTVEAVIVQAADALSGARPGARGESLEHYVKRLRDLEEIATRHAGVDRVYAMQAGREIRVMVQPGAVDDDAAVLLSRDIAREIEKELEYPGQIKVTVIRESRAVDYAR